MIIPRRIDNAKTIIMDGRRVFVIPLGRWGLTENDTEDDRRKKFIGTIAYINGKHYHILGLESFHKLDPLLGDMILRVEETYDGRTYVTQ